MRLGVLVRSIAGLLWLSLGASAEAATCAVSFGMRREHGAGGSGAQHGRRRSPDRIGQGSVSPGAVLVIGNRRRFLVDFAPPPRTNSARCDPFGIPSTSL